MASYDPRQTQLENRQAWPRTVDSVHIGLVLDQSESMLPIKAQTIDSFNRLLDEQRQLQAQARFSVALFNDEVTLLFDNVPVAQMVPLSLQSYQPMGATALNDAVGKLIQSLDAHVSRLSSVLVAILTDGEENSSCHFSAADIERMIGYRARRGWQFVFLGPKSAGAYARRLGIPEDHIFSFDASAESITDLYRRLSASLAAWRLGDSAFVLQLRDKEAQAR